MRLATRDEQITKELEKVPDLVGSDVQVGSAIVVEPIVFMGFLEVLAQIPYKTIQINSKTGTYYFLWRV